MSQEIEIERRLAAVLAADVAGFSRLTEADEIGTLRLLAAQRAILDEAIARHRGRIANTAGDSVLAEFPSAVNAVQCAVEAQQALRDAAENVPADRRVLFRVGIHVGDVMVRRGDLLGTGVNVAARLEGLADAGGIVLSAAAHDQVKKILPLAYTDLGLQSVKNIEEPVRAFVIGSAAAASPASAFAGLGKPLPFPDKPSIAVLPFQNMSGDPEQEYFADGIVEDIITALSRFKSLFVIARNSSFTYKGKAVDIKQVGRELGVRYVLEGSVRKAGNRVRITGQLVEAEYNRHIWADKFDGKLEEVFDLQDKVTSSVAGVIAPRIEQAEIERASQRPTADLVAYDYYLRGLSTSRWSREENDEAIRLFTKAIELDPNFVSAMGRLVDRLNMRRQQGWIINPELESAQTVRLMRRALELGKDDAWIVAGGAFTLAYHTNELNAAISLSDRALQLNPNEAAAWAMAGWIRIYAGSPELAIEHFQRALQLNPIDPLNHTMMNGIAFAHYFAGRNDQSILWAEKVLNEHPTLLPALRIFISACSSDQQHERAEKAVQQIRELNPDERISSVPILSLLRKPDHQQKMISALRQAGLPE